MHIHVEKGGNIAKFNLFPVEVMKSKGFRAVEIAEMRKLVTENI